MDSPDRDEQQGDATREEGAPAAPRPLAADREARLAAALRENLRRRKAQARAREAMPPAGSDPEPER